MIDIWDIFLPLQRPGCGPPTKEENEQSCRYFVWIVCCLRRDDWGRTLSRCPVNHGLCITARNSTGHLDEVLTAARYTRSPPTGLDGPL